MAAKKWQARFENGEGSLAKAVACEADRGKPSGLTARSGISRRALVGLLLTSTLCGGATDCEERAKDEQKKYDDEKKKIMDRVEKVKRRKRTGPMILNEDKEKYGGY